MKPDSAQEDIHELPNEPTIVLTLEFDSALSNWFAEDTSSLVVASSIAERRVSDFMATLGIPGKPKMQITTLAETPLHQDQDDQFGDNWRFLRLSVHHQYCPYPIELLCSVQSYIEMRLPLFETTPTSILSWLQTLPGEQVAEFLALTCVEIIKLRPSVLLALPQVEAYLALLAPVGEKETFDAQLPQADWLLPVLCAVLDMYISLADRQKVLPVLALSTEAQHSQEDVSEALIDALVPQYIEIQLAQDYLRELTTHDIQNGPEKFTTLRNELFAELGVRWPPFRFVSREDSKAQSFAFKLHHVTTLPWVGLQANQGIFLAAEPSSVTNIIIPGIEVACQLVDLGFTGDQYPNTLKQLDYLLLCLKETLKKNRRRFVNRSFVNGQLDILRKDYPILVNAVDAKEISSGQLTRILRALVVEHTSIREMRFLLERLLDYFYTSRDPARNSILNYWMNTSVTEEESWFKDLQNVVPFLRASMKRGDLILD